jgi:hypothetical protein
MIVSELYCARCGRGPGHAHIFDEQGVCWQCGQARKQQGLAADPGQPLRPLVPCIRCAGRAFVRVPNMRERGITGMDHTRERFKPLAVTFAVGQGVDAGSAEPIGLLEAYVCRTCGFTELYTKNAAEIPIGDAYGTEAFDVPGSPFR